jgi:2-dehydro-3-deoxy-D-arabinonate dehydratase
MKWFQARGADGGAGLGFVRGESALVLREAHAGVLTTLDLLEAQEEHGLDSADWLSDAEAAGAFAELGWADLVDRAAGNLACPVTPPEVWGAGVTYRRSADFREEGTGIYDRVYDAERPELFFKASAGRCAAPGEAIGRRHDSTFTATEPELGLVLGRRGTILGFTLANDVSAWDIERDNPLYLPQSKIYRGCFSFGPVIVTPDEIEDPYALTLGCRILRDGKEIFTDETSTARVKRRYTELVEWLLRSNEIATGTVLSTGTGIIQPLEVGLEEGDVVEISCPEIGTLVNPVATV